MCILYVVFGKVCVMVCMLVHAPVHVVALCLSLNVAKCGGKGGIVGL